MADRSALSVRLKRLRQAGNKVEKKTHPSKVPILEDWEKIGKYTYKKETIYDDPFLNFPKEPFLITAGQNLSELTFFDIETTGLSGGAGNISFLTGFGKRNRAGFTVTQFFLSDFPGETEYLKLILENINTTDVFVSYNGKSFDTNILKTRYIMNGMRFALNNQLDLLYPSRRLWKSLIGSCSLGNIEYSILKIERELDVPGFMIPDIFSNFLKTGKTDALLPVFAHHQQDIVSLAKLLVHIENICSNPDEHMLVDKYALGLLVRQKNKEIGDLILQKAYKTGCSRSGRALSLFYKRKGNIPAATEIWEKLFSGGSIFAGIELSKYYEHKLKTPERALDIVNQILNKQEIFISKIHKDLLYRKERLLRKIKYLK